MHLLVLSGTFPRIVYQKNLVFLLCRKNDGLGTFYKAIFDIAPNGETSNVRVTYVDRSCAKPHIEKMIDSWQYECSDNGRKDMWFATFIGY